MKVGKVLCCVSEEIDNGIILGFLISRTNDDSHNLSFGGFFASTPLRFSICAKQRSRNRRARLFIQADSVCLIESLFLSSYFYMDQLLLQSERKVTLTFCFFVLDTHKK